MSHSSFLSDVSGFYSEPSHESLENTQPFKDAESAWFWCVQTSEAIHSGARLEPGRATTPRPCEAVDIQKIVLRLARENVLTPNHVKAMVDYGPRQERPSRPLPNFYWQQAMETLTPLFQQKGIVA